jgi:hypothetical protein
LVSGVGFARENGRFPVTGRNRSAIRHLYGTGELMSQPARHLHVVEPLAERVVPTLHRFAERIGLTGVVLALVCCIAAWMASTVRLLGWIFNG